MRTVIICCDPSWTQWRALVRTRALDLFRGELATEFWDCANPAPDNDAAVWGNWPRVFSLGGPTVVADLGYRAEQLAESDGMAVLFIYARPDDVDAGVAPSNAEGQPIDAEDLRQFKRRLTALEPDVTNRRVLRIGVFRCEPSEGAIPPELFDSAFFVGSGGLARNDASLDARQFDAVRLIADIAGDAEEEGERRLWRLLGQPAGPTLCYRLRVPPNAWSAHPSAVAVSAVTTFIDKQTAARGLSRMGETMKDLNKLKTEIKDHLTRSTAAFPWLNAAGVIAPENERGFVEQMFKEEQRLSLPAAPGGYEERQAAAFVADTVEAVRRFLGDSRQRIRRIQAEKDLLYKKYEDDASEMARRTVNAVKTGMTTNAQRHLREVVTFLRGEREAFTARCEASRDRVAQIVAQQRAPNSRAAGRRDGKLPIEWFGGFRPLEENGYAFEVAEANCRNLGLAAWPLVGVLLTLYGLFALHIVRTHPATSYWRAALLGTDVTFLRNWYVITLVLTAACSLIILWFIRERAVREWRHRRGFVEDSATALGSAISAIDFHTVRQADAAAVLSWMVLIERSLSSVLDTVAAEPLDAALNLLRDERQLPGLGDAEQHALENTLADRLASEPMARWIRVILETLPPARRQLVTLELPNGEEHVRSQLVPMPRFKVRIERVEVD